MYRNSNDDIYFFLVDHWDGVGDGVGEADDHVPGNSRPVLQLSVLHVHVHVVVVTVLPVFVVVIILLIVVFLKWRLYHYQEIARPLSRFTLGLLLGPLLLLLNSESHLSKVS